MNLCFFMGKIVSKIEFEFMLNSKNNSICYYKIELKNNSIITVKCYDDMADYCYRNLKINDEIFIYGRLESNMEVVIESIDSKRYVKII